MGQTTSIEKLARELGVNRAQIISAGAGLNLDHSKITTEQVETIKTNLRRSSTQPNTNIGTQINPPEPKVSVDTDELTTAIRCNQDLTNQTVQQYANHTYKTGVAVSEVANLTFALGLIEGTASGRVSVLQNIIRNDHKAISEATATMLKPDSDFLQTLRAKTIQQSWSEMNKIEGSLGNPALAPNNWMRL